MEKIVELINVSKRYPGVKALDQVHFEMHAGEVRALLGKNGAGKSTLIRLLTGVEIPDSGDIIIHKNRLTGTGAGRTTLAVSYGISSVYQELSLIGEMTVAENIYLGYWQKKKFSIDTKKMYEDARAIIKKLGFTLNIAALVSSLSPAEQQMVEISRAMARSSRLIILDEPTSSLSNTEVTQLFNAIRSMSHSGVAVLYVSHRMKEIREIASVATIMRDGKIIDTVMLADTNTDVIIRKMIGDTNEQKNITVQNNANKQETILSVHNISFSPKLKNITFDLYKGEVLGIAGVLGSGRTEILKIISGLYAPEEGSVIYNGTTINNWSYVKRIKHGIAITPENRKNDGLLPLLGIDENIVSVKWDAISKLGILSEYKIIKETQAIIQSMNVKTESTKTPISNLSGGNQQKIVIGRWIYAQSKVLLLDEPTRGIDIAAKNQIYALVRYLSSCNISVLFISSEVEELPLVCDRILVLRNGEIHEEFNQPNINIDTVVSTCTNI